MNFIQALIGKAIALRPRRGTTAECASSTTVIDNEIVVDTDKATLVVMQPTSNRRQAMEREGFLFGQEIPPYAALEDGDTYLLSWYRSGEQSALSWFDLSTITEALSQHDAAFLEYDNKLSQHDAALIEFEEYKSQAPVGGLVLRNWKSFASGDLSGQTADSTGQISSLTAPGTPLNGLSGVYKTRVVSDNGGALMEFWDISTGRYYGVRGFDPNGGGPGIGGWTVWSVVDSQATGGGGAVGILVDGESVTEAATGINFSAFGIPLEYSSQDGLVTIQLGKKLGTPTYPLLSQYTALDGAAEGERPDSAGVFYTLTTGGIDFGEDGPGATAVKGGFLDGHLPENCYFAVRFSNDQNREFQSLIILSLQDKITPDMSGDPSVLQSFILCIPGSLAGGSAAAYAFSVITTNEVSVQLPSVLPDTASAPEFGIELAGSDTYIHVDGVKTKIHDAGHLKALYMGGGSTVDVNNTITRTEIVEPSPGVMATLEAGSVLLTPELLTPAEAGPTVRSIKGEFLDGDNETVSERDPALWDFDAVKAMARKYAHLSVRKSGGAQTDKLADHARGLLFQDSADDLYKFDLVNYAMVNNTVYDQMLHRIISISGPRAANVSDLNIYAGIVPLVWSTDLLYKYIDRAIERMSLKANSSEYFPRSAEVASDGSVIGDAISKLPGVQSIVKSGIGTYDISFVNSTYASFFCVSAVPQGPFTGVYAGKVFTAMAKRSSEKWIVSLYEISTGTPVLADANFVIHVSNATQRNSSW